MLMYHYTSQEAITSITISSKFQPSSFETSLDDAVYGKGWYFTDLNPNTPDSTLFTRLWNMVVPSRVKNYIVFDIDKSILTRCRDHVWKVDFSKIDTDHMDISTSYTRNSDSTVVIKFVKTATRSSVSDNVDQDSDSTDWGKVIGGVALFIGAAAILKMMFGGK